MSARIFVFGGAAVAAYLLTRKKLDTRVDDPAGNLARPGQRVKGRSGRTWETKFMRVLGEDVFTSVFFPAGTQHLIICYKSKRGLKNAPRFLLGGPPEAPPKVVADAIKDFGVQRV